MIGEKYTSEWATDVQKAYKDAICCGQSYGSIYDYMRIIGLKKKQQKEVTKYISKLREVGRQNND